MKPIKAKTLIPKTAELTGFKEKTCEIVVAFYYKELRQKLSEMEEPCIQVEKMGNFYLKERVLDHKERDFLEMKESILKWPEGIRKTSILRNVEEQLERIARNKIKIQQRKDKRTATIQKQHEYRAAQIRLEEQSKDSSGVVE